MLDELGIESLMSRPDLPRIADSLNAILRDEQLRRAKFHDELTPSVKAEFIGGAIVTHSPVKAKHLQVTDKLVRLLSSYVQSRELGEVFTEKALVCLTRNDYEPDICFFGIEKAAAFDGETIQFPAPDMVVEVLSESMEHRDRGVKWGDYGMHGVLEYWIIDCDEQSIEQYLIRSGQTKYHLARKLTDGDIESVVVSGFRIPVASLFDTKQNLQALQKILNDNSLMSEQLGLRLQLNDGELEFIDPGTNQRLLTAEEEAERLREELRIL